MHFAHPAWLLLLLLLPALIAGSLVIASLRGKQWTELMAPRLRPALLKSSSNVPRWLAIAFLITASTAMIFAIARPRGDAGTSTEKTIGRNLLIALDLSRSMRVQDVQPDRLSQAKLVIYEMIEAMPQERIGLIGFAGDAYLYAPLTIDHQAVKETVEQIDEEWAPVGGSNLARCIDIAIQTLKETGQKNNALVILSDGEKHDGDLQPLIEEAERSGVYILAIGVGTENGDYIPHPDFPDNRMVDRDGKPVISRLQPDVMRKLAEETRGRYATAGSGSDIPRMIKAAISDLDSFEMEGRERTIYVEFYQWLLLPAILLLMGSIIANTRWRGVGTSLLLACFFLQPSDAQADNAISAKQALDSEDYKQAQRLYHNLAEFSIFPSREAKFRLGEATAAYSAEDFRMARKAYSQAILSDDKPVKATGHIGMGNTLFQLGWQLLTDQSYPTNSNTPPKLELFDAIVKNRLDQLKNGKANDEKNPFSYKRFETIIINWADAIRHYDSSIVAEKTTQAVHNREMTYTYLKRLEELLKQDEQDTKDNMPLPEPQSGEPQEGTDPKQPPQDGDEGGEPDPNAEGGDENPNEQDGSGDEGDQEPKQPKPGNEDTEPKAADPNKTPEENARELLKENADLEKGPITPGRRFFRNPEKDW